MNVRLRRLVIQMASECCDLIPGLPLAALTLASRLLHYDIPETVSRMEERIRRVCRIGQPRDVQFLVLLSDEEADSESWRPPFS